MKCPSPLGRGVVPSLLALAALALMPATSATAASLETCKGQVAEQPFMPWADPAHYVLVPNGALEEGWGWDFKGGAARNAGNEAFHVHDQRDSRSLALPAGSSATTGSMCVGLEHPTLRLFATNRGAPWSSLLVEVLFEDASGGEHALPIGAYLATSAWQPTAPLAVVANLFATLPGEHVEVAFRFTPKGAGNWSIDDVYVDPFRHG